MLKVVNFFKSYKVHLLDISTVYKAFDKRENSIKVYEDWFMYVKKNPTDYSQIIEEITADVNITKVDKINLLEKVYFEIERWEFRNLTDKFEFDIKAQISKLMNELTPSDYVYIRDYYKEEYPFAGIEYTFEKDDKSFVIDSISPEVNKNANDIYNILEKIKFYYETE